MMGKTNASGVSVISMITANLLLGEGRGGKRKLVSRADYSREIVNRMCTIREMFQFAVRFAVNSKRVNPVCLLESIVHESRWRFIFIEE